MAEFLTQLDVEFLGKGRWRVESPLAFRSDVLQTTVVVPPGFETDFASVPRIPVVFELTGDTAHEAAVVHDYLYGSDGISRAQADAVLREAMGASGEPAWRRWAMWAAVRVFGGLFYKGKEAANVAGQ